MTTRIFITGCARSGTTLLRRLFYAFENAHVIPHEIRLDDFLATPIPDGKILVGKRWVTTVLSNQLPASEIGRQLDLAGQDRNLWIVNIIRSGWDVIWRPKQSTQCSPARWISSISQACAHPNLIDATVRYEDLCADPDAVQATLAETLALTPRHPFSDYPAFLPEDDNALGQQYRPRPISTDSIGHPPDLEARFSSEAELQTFIRLNEQLGYETPAVLRA